MSNITSLHKIWDNNKEYQKIELLPSSTPTRTELKEEKKVRSPRRVKSSQIPIFGEKLGLVSGEPANLYRDIVDLYEYYNKNKPALSDRFPALFRMALRLQCELIVKCTNSRELVEFIKAEYEKAKQMLSQQEKTFLSNNNVTKDNFIGLLHTGAHNYEASYDLSQTIAMSLIVAGLLKLHCAKQGK